MICHLSVSVTVESALSSVSSQSQWKMHYVYCCRVICQCEVNVTVMCHSHSGKCTVPSHELTVESEFFMSYSESQWKVQCAVIVTVENALCHVISQWKVHCCLSVTVENRLLFVVSCQVTTFHCHCDSVENALSHELTHSGK